MSNSKSYQDLIVWQKSMDLVESIYQITWSFPKEEIFGLTSQMRRAAVSIPSNIAEGQSRNSNGEFRQFLGIAQGSLSELETQLMISQRLKLISSEQMQIPIQLCQEVGKMLNGLKSSLK
ncbi:MAG: four helix bundle protein [Flavobacteriales bacterium]|nr:four helix bundle protein [Flavobacteriales bacterium]MBW7854295.1 four helix bundle protein [Candidatus Kapabacteria bacterium]MCC6332043.1 four helix bundle protein [Ignavibacteria bacterium]NOG67727.1 four helix bundle protein [Chlorobiota bacterium]MBZ0193999.1 four helix bundle protein [Candidatus Kapabacteria bacterium]